MDLLSAAKGGLHVVADILGADYFFEFRLMDQAGGLLARATENQGSIGRVQLAGDYPRRANSPVASRAFILRSRRITTGGSVCRFSVTTEILSVAPNRNGPWMRKMVA